MLACDMIQSAQFDAKMVQSLLERLDFDWGRINPTMFGSMFQGAIGARQRRELGAHYTSDENILKLINPLFLDGLWLEFERVKADPAALDRFHDKIARLKFLDPACGCGNFLIVAYRELRMLELEILKMKVGSSQSAMDITPMRKVCVGQFYGIEIEDYPCQIVQQGMGLVEQQMNVMASEHFGLYSTRLPLTHSVTIVHGNALRLDWETIVPKNELSYILGNPPFVGYSNQSKKQKGDILSVFLDGNGKTIKNAGRIDYVAAWFYKAAQYIHGKQSRVAFVSTNSITQGEQVATVWKPLYDMFGIHINFAHRSFKWGNEAKGKASVHCVIIGFGTDPTIEKVIFDGKKRIIAKDINPYLVDAPNTFVERRKKPICNVPEMMIGNRISDGGHLIIAAEEYEQFVRKEPAAAKYIRPYMMGKDFLTNKERYCLWPVDVSPAELRKMPLVLERIKKCQKIRLASLRSNTRRAAKTPTLFESNRQPETDYIAIPAVSSEHRRYIPIGYLGKEVIAGDNLFTIPNASLYHFGLLTSNVHSAWMRAVGGRHKMSYRYSNTVVYNNFPWPETTAAQRVDIELLAQAILDARALFPDSSLAALYDPLAMPPELLKAHQALDRAVMKLYGFPVTAEFTEAHCVAALMELYQAHANAAKA